jgi:hypothetical protein
VSYLDKVIIGAGIGLIILGIGFLIVAPSMFEIREPLILGGLLWSVVGGITLILGISINYKKNKQFGAFR